MSLIELMISMTLGILIVAGMATLFMQNKNSYRQDEQIARMQEDARYALNLLVDDIELAGFWANLFDPTSITADDELTLTQDCGAAAGWLYSVDQAVTAYDKPDNANAISTVFSCITAGNHQANTDAIAIKRLEGAVTEVADLDNDTVYLQTNGVLGLLYEQDPGLTPDVVVPAPLANWKYIPKVYYVRSFADTAGDGIPTLCRYALDFDGATPTMAEECLAQGVENLQLEYGIDTDADGVANRYLSGPTAAQLASQLVSIRVNLLMRSLQEDVNYTNLKTYSVGNVDFDPPDDGYYRRVYTTTVLLRNPRNLQCMNTGNC